MVTHYGPWTGKTRQSKPWHELSYFWTVNSVKSSLSILLSFENSHFVILQRGLPSFSSHVFLSKVHTHIRRSAEVHVLTRIKPKNFIIYFFRMHYEYINLQKFLKHINNQLYLTMYQCSFYLKQFIHLLWQYFQ